MKLSDVIEEVMREFGAKEEDILFARSEAFAKICPSATDRETFNRDLPPDQVEFAKNFVRMTLMRIAIDPEFEDQLKKEANEGIEKN